MVSKQAIPAWFACVAAVFAAATTVLAQPEAVEAALREAGMDDVLEAHLLTRLARTSEESERDALIDRLAEMYTRTLRALSDADPGRDAITQRAWRLADLAGERKAVELRLMLLLDEYLPLERTVELHELGLLSEDERPGAIEDLDRLHGRFLQMARAAVIDAAAAERRQRSSESEDFYEGTREAYRIRSLANYYAAWSGLTLAVLEDRAPSADVARAFGWLLGSGGELPKLDDVGASALELEHVARAVIGVARARALSEDWILAEQWLGLLIDAEGAPAAIGDQARGRMLRFKADQGEWMRAAQVAAVIRRDDEPLATPDARYLAMRALEAVRSRSDGRDDARGMAELALGDLIRRGEIGHVLDLRQRYDATGLLGAGFVGRYAEALDHLDLAQDAGTPGLYGAAAGKLVAAAESEDADRFPAQRDDALLKAVFCEIRAGQPRRALGIVRELLDSGPAAEAEQEARWLLVVALDETSDERLRDELASAVRDYIARYPGTERAHRLLVRHAGSDMLEPQAIAEGLRDVGDADPVVLSARRVLAQLVYRVWTDSRRTDRRAREELLGLTDWIWARESDPANPAPPRDRLDTARIALDVTLGSSPQDTDRAERALRIAREALLDDPSLARHADELTLRSVELHAAAGRPEQAAADADALRRAASPLGVTADRLLLAAIFEGLTQHPDDPALMRLGVRIGSRLSGDLIPPAPQTLGPEASRVIDRVWRLAATLSEAGDDPGMTDLAIRLGEVVLDRGEPTAQGLRELAELAARAKRPQTELAAWSTLLAASRDTEPVWWEARYHTLRLLLESDPDAAERAFRQHKVLHPFPGLLPWTTMIDDLFPDRPTAGSEPTP